MPETQTQPSTGSRLMAELVGTFVLVLGGLAPPSSPLASQENLATQ